MRIIAGKYKGRTIKTIKGTATRPTLDKVREAVFNILGQYFDGGVALDLFAGSGALGIEAVSRGINKCIFVDVNIEAIKVIKENLKSLGIESSEVIKGDALKALDGVLKNYQFDLVFLDPPYHKNLIDTVLCKLIDNNLLKKEAVVVVESSKEENFIERYKSIMFQKSYLYGITKIAIYKNVGDDYE